MIATNDAVKKLVHIAEAVPLEECEAVEHGQEPCPLQYDDAEEWCLPCQAKKAVADYMDDSPRSSSRDSAAGGLSG